jgi:integrase
MSASVDIQLRGGKHQVRWREVNGRRRARTFTRERDATRFAAQVRTTLEAGGILQLEQEIPTLAAFMEEYWRVYALPNLSPNTREVYKRVWAKHARPRLGHMTLRAITPGAVNRQLVEPMRRGGAGEPVILKTLTMLQSVMALAVLHHGDVVPTNPVRAVRKPSQARRDAEPIWPTVVEQIRARLPHRDATIVSVLAYAGLRPEEMLALRWGDVRGDVLVVERAVARGELRGDDLRKRHNRLVTLLAPLAKDLAEWRMASGRPVDRALVLPRAGAGGLWQDTDWRNWRTRVWQPVAAAVGLATLERTFTTELVDGQRRRRQTSRYEGPGPYQLRGSFVSLLIQEGKTVVYVANQAGHTPETCLRHYARLFRDAPTVPVPAEVAIRKAREAVARDRAGRGADATDRSPGDLGS